MHYQLNLDWGHFLQNYWQKRPVLLKQALLNFIDPISPDELAGLAMEDEVDSRLVSHSSGVWQVKHGPFDSYDHLGETDWSLLVQAVNHWHSAAATLLTPFNKLPNWRLDDLMISYSVPGGGVGPHQDQYDVFIIQGSGRRRWRVGELQPLKAHLPHPDLLQVESFNAIIDEETLPGDLLYIPPGFPHEGYALENSLNYSVGFRAPNARELISGFADYVLENELGGKRYTDPELALRQDPSTLLPNELQKLQQMMINLIQQPDSFQSWLGEFVSSSRHELDLAPPEPPYQVDEIYDLLQQGDSLLRLGGVRVIHVNDHCYINGEKIVLPASQVTNILSQHSPITVVQLGELLEDPTVLSLLTELINCGYWYFAD